MKTQQLIEDIDYGNFVPDVDSHEGLARLQLLDQGFNEEQLEAAWPIMQSYSRICAIEFLANISEKLKGTAGGEGLRRALGLADDSLADAAQRAECSRPAVLKHENKCRAKLGG